MDRNGGSNPLFPPCRCLSLEAAVDRMFARHPPNASQAPAILVNSSSLGLTELVKTPPSASSPAAPIFSMTLGAISNIVALLILVQSYTRFRRRSKATFLLFASSLVITDLAGHVIPGSFVLQLYATQRNWTAMDPSKALCQFFGASMVFFGLCPLFLGFMMAVERCIGITRPLLHAAMVTPGRTKLSLVGLWTIALAIALLPLCSFGKYVVQAQNTWCFIKVKEAEEWTEIAFALLFSLLGLASLVASLICNTFSGLILVRARLRGQRKCGRRRAKAHDIEMVVQLVGIMVVSCICWSPLLVSINKQKKGQWGHLGWLAYILRHKISEKLACIKPTPP